MHLATIYLVWAGTWLSAYFIIVANSWMQHPVGYTIDKSTGTAQANDIAAIIFQKFAIYAYVHVILAGCLTGGFVDARRRRVASAEGPQRRRLPVGGEARDPA